MVTDVEVIARASGGRALYGAFVGGSDDRLRGKRAKKELLCPTEQCKLKNSDQEYQVWSRSSSDVRASERFRREVENSGWSAALSLNGDGIFGFGVNVSTSAGGGRTSNKQMSASSQEMTKEACHMQVLYCPKASFTIPVHQMQLSETALNDARRVQNPSDAKKFLEDYNSHVSTDIYHVGGVLMKCLVMKSSTATSLQRMLEKVSYNANVSAGVDFAMFPIPGGKVEFNISNDSSSASADQEGRSKTTVEYHYTALGPRTDEEVRFKAGLVDKSTWDIIDKTDGPDLVPVWEIPSVKNAQDLQSCCDLLREAWQNSVKSIAAQRNGRINALLQASCMGYIKSLLATSSASNDCTTLRRVWLVKTDCLDTIRTKDLFHLNEFHDLLGRLAESKETDELNDGPKLLRNFMTHDVQVWLDREGMSLRNSVQAVLRNEHIKQILPLPPLQNMSLDELVNSLKTILGRQTSGARAPIIAFESDSVAKVLRDFFRRNPDGGNLVREVRSLITNHGFYKDGVIRDLTRVTKEEVKHLVDELESKTSGSQPSTGGIVGKISSFSSASTSTNVADDVVTGAATLDGSYLQTSDVLGRNSHILDLETSNKTREKGSIRGDIVYGRDMLVDRPKDISGDPHRQMLDRVRHRLEIFASISSKPADAPKRKNYFAHATTKVNKDRSGHEITKSHSTTKSSPLVVLVQLLTSSDLPAQTALLQLLLDARIAIPLVVPLNTRSEGNRSLGHLAEALDFVRVKLAKQEVLSIAEDTKLPRVVFVSNRKIISKRETSHMASKVMNFQLPSKFSKVDIADGNTILELGVGFLRIAGDESRNHKACLVFCVWGDHNRLGEFLAKAADFLIVEMDPSEDASSLSWNTGHAKDQTLYWKIDPSDEGYENEPYLTFWGSFQQIADEIEGYLHQGIVEEKLFEGASERGAATLEQCLTSISPFTKKTSVFNLANLDGIKIEKAKESLQLQRNFAREADFYFESLRRKGDPEYVSRMQELQKKRKKLSPEILNLPLLQTFLSILSLQNYVERNIGIVNFELNIEKKLHLILKRAYEKEAQAFEESQQHEDDRKLKDKYIRARKDHMDKKLGLEHVWRELSHIFVANPHLKFLPQRAAEHMVDGFPLEILDGDASLFNSLWVETVLSELHIVLSASLKRKPKVFVLSVIGLQSSGKSTLLNVMFGTKLKTSAGQCTRGVYLQLIKSERKEFDYLLILDTEGIRSPEFYRGKNAEVHDNRLATFAVLPADACIVLVANEEDSGLKEVLPMVMLAFKDSAMAVKCAGRRQAQVFFAYRSVDTNDLTKLGRNQRKLQEDLRSASKDIGNVPTGVTRNSSPGSSRSNNVVDTLLRDFRFSTNEEESDVKYFGNLKTGNIPPGDTPDWDYGTKVERLREYIHKRVTDDGSWQGYELKSWATQLKLVWDCIAEANFEISFRNQMEYFQFQLLQEQLVTSRKNVGKKWLEEFEKLVGDLQVERSTVQGLDQSYERFLSKLKLTVQKTVDESAKEVTAILEHPQWQKWKVEELANWDRFCSKQEREWPQRLQDSFDAVFKFDNVVKDYNAKIKMEIEAKTRNFDDTQANRQKIMETEFREIFQRILLEAQSVYPPMAESVPSRVTSVYQDAPIGQRFDFSKDEPTDSYLQVRATNSWIPKNLLGFAYSTDKKDSRVQDTIAVLESTVKVHLQNAKQYADHLVEEIISFTDKSLEEEKVSKPDQGAVHRHVKRLLTKKLGTIQAEYDNKHNISKRIAQEERRLWLFFENCVNRVDGTKLLFSEIDHLLQSKLMDLFRINLSKPVSNKLFSDAWAGNWIVMRAHLDLHLIDLIEKKDTRQLLMYVRNGAIHYKLIVDSLIEQEVDRQLKDGRLWESFLKAIQQAVRAAAIGASLSESGSSKSSEFAKKLVASLNEKISDSQNLTRDIINYLSEGVHSKYDNNIDFDTLANDVCQGLDKIEPDRTSSSVQEVVKLVTERMIKSATDNVGPRCTKTCPRCGVICSHPTSHSGAHDTLHQPAGLCGEYDWRTRELRAFSCSASVAAEHVFQDLRIGVTEWTPFKDWCTHYPEWKLPTKGNLGSVQVREYIFAHYQNELINTTGDEDSRTKICSTIPPEFLLHDIGKLRRELENTIASA